MNKGATEYFTIIPRNLINNLLKKRLTASELNTSLVITDKIYGWRKIEDDISISQIMEAIGIKNRRTVFRTLKSLIEKRVIIKKSNGFKKVSTFLFHPEMIDQSSVTSDTSLETPEFASSVNPDTRPSVTSASRSSVTSDTHLSIVSIGEKERTSYTDQQIRNAEVEVESSKLNGTPLYFVEKAKERLEKMIAANKANPAAPAQAGSR